MDEDAESEDKKAFKVPSDILKPPPDKTEASEAPEAPQALDDILLAEPDTSKISKKSDQEPFFRKDLLDVPKKSQVRRVSFEDEVIQRDEKIVPESSDTAAEDTVSDSSTTQDKNKIPEKSDRTIEESTSGSSDGEKPTEVTSRRRKPKERPSFIRRKLIKFEKELTMENINKKVTRIFSPGVFKKGKENSSKGDKDVEVKKPERSYLSSTMASIFLIAIITGSGILSLPYYLKLSTWFGVFLIILLGLNSMYGGFCVAWSWIIMEEMWPEYVEYSRTPYQEIAYRASGLFMKYIVAIFIDVSVIGTCSVYVILSAESIENISYLNLHFCYLMVVVIVILLPFTMLGSYRNMKFIGILDVVLSISFTFFLIISFFLDKPSQGTSTYSNPAFDSFVLAFAGFSFAYAAGPAYCSILLDMEDRTLFVNSCATAYLVVMIMYIVFAIMGYAAYGDGTPAYILREILTNETYRPMGIFIDILYIFQLMTSFVCFLIPSLHAFEVRLKCPDQFGFGRVILRSLIVACIILLTEGIPFMSSYMEVVGATTINLLTYVLPPIFYLSLVNQQAQHSKRYISKKEWALIVETVAIGVVVAVVTTVTRFDFVKSSTEGRTSCYVNLTKSEAVKPWLSLRRV